MCGCSAEIFISTCKGAREPIFHVAPAEGGKLFVAALLWTNSYFRIALSRGRNSIYLGHTHRRWLDFTPSFVFAPHSLTRHRDRPLPSNQAGRSFRGTKVCSPRRSECTHCKSDDGPGRRSTKGSSLFPLPFTLLHRQHSAILSLFNRRHSVFICPVQNDSDVSCSLGINVIFEVVHRVLKGGTENIFKYSLIQPPFSSTSSFCPF